MRRRRPFVVEVELTEHDEHIARAWAELAQENSYLRLRVDELTRALVHSQRNLATLMRIKADDIDAIAEKF